MAAGLLICQLKDVIGLFSLGLLALLHGCKMAAHSGFIYHVLT